MHKILNIYKKTTAVLMVAFVFFACSNEDILADGDDSASDEIIHENITLTFLQDDDSSAQLPYLQGDGISVTYVLDGAWRKNFYKSEPQSASDVDGGFKVKTDLSSDLTGSLEFYGIYPQMAADMSSLPSVPIVVPSKQKPSAASWDKSAEVLIGRSVEEYDSVPSEPIYLRWNKALTYLCLSFSNLSIEAGETLESVEISANEGIMITGDCILDMETSECKPKDPGTSGVLTLDISSLKVSKSGDLNVWSILIPSKIEAIDLTLTTSKARYTIAISDFDGEFLSGQTNDLEIDLAKAQKQVLPQGVYRELFDVLDLDYPGLESVKAEYLKADFAAAADALVEYYRTRPVYDPAIDITKTVMYEEDKRVANQSLEHRFCVRRSYWYESVSDDGKHFTYWDFDDQKGNINWDFVLPGAGQENYQVHWHQWFKYVAWAQVLTGDDKYFNNWKEIYSDWLEHFPCPGPDGSTTWQDSPTFTGLKPTTEYSFVARYVETDNFFASPASEPVVVTTSSVQVSAYPPIMEQPDEGGSVTISPKYPNAGSEVTITPEPDEGYEVDQVIVTDKDGNPVKVTDNGDGTYSFTQPKGKVTIKVTFTDKTQVFFVDVPANAYYYDAVYWAVKHEITYGTSDTTFSPDEPCTREQAVTFLWRAAGCPEPTSSEMPFTDVKTGDYCYNAVLWAVENGITNGTSATTFSPDAVCSRGQIVTFLWRSQKSPASDSANPFADVAADAYYNSAVLWAVTNGITDGTSATTFSPAANCTRAQIVTFLFRCLGGE